MPVAWIDGDPTVRDFNFSAPNLGSTCTHQELAQWIDEGRKGNSSALSCFASAMYWTLRPAAFECYLRTYVRRPIAYPDWFYSKLLQFLRTLMDGDPGTPFADRLGNGLYRLIPDYSDAELDRERLRQTVKPEDTERLDWLDLVRTVSERTEDREATLWAWFERQNQTQSPRTESQATARRNSLIRQARVEGRSGRQTCEILDRNGIVTTSEMRKAGVLQWTVAWDDPDFRKNVQTIFSKAKAR